MSTETKQATFTPGPWPEPQKTGDGKTIWFEKDGPGNDNWHRLSVEIDSDDCDSDTAMANARLISASPEMLNVCRRFLELYNDSVTRPSGIDWLRNLAVAAVTKAEGRS